MLLSSNSEITSLQYYSIQEGAFDEAVKGVVAIEHTASPFHFKAKKPDDVIIPAVHGTRAVLQSALKFGTDVKRFVLTSSWAAIEEVRPEGRVYTEDDWNQLSIDQVKGMGDNTPPSASYRASKSLAEKAAWIFVEQHKSEIGFDLVSMCPPLIYGPVLQEMHSVASLNTSMELWYQAVILGQLDNTALVAPG